MSEQEALATQKLTHLAVGPTTLNVKSLQSVGDFYTNMVGLTVLKQTASTLLLGHASKPLLKLITTPDLPHAITTSAGLYHNAILFNSRATLAITLERMLQQVPAAFVGSADHLVSEAFYFTDPEGNGLELYADRDHTKWQWQDGQVLMASNYLDPQQFITSHRNEKTPATGASALTMGHVHLKVGHLPTARRFYVDILGLSVVAAYPGALFLSDGLYHHHLGLNTWESLGAPLRVPSLGLAGFTLIVDTATDLKKLALRLASANVTYTTGTNQQLTTQDPWGSTLRIVTRSQSADHA